MGDERVEKLEDEIGSLELENRELKGEVAELVKEVQSLREQGRDIEAELDTATRDRDSLCACMIGNRLAYHQVGGRRKQIQVWIAVDREFRSYPEAKAFLLNSLRSMAPQVQDMPSRYLVVELRRLLATMKPGSRLDVIDKLCDGYCIHCGDAIDDVCHCTNDE